MAGKILEAELRITGSDKTGAAFAGVLKHAEQLKKALGGLNSVRIGGADFQAANNAIRQQTSLLRTERMAAQEVTRSIAAGNEALVARSGLMSRLHQRWQGLAGVSGMGWMIGGLASGRLAHKVSHDVGEFEHQRAMLSVASGMKPDEVARAVDQAIALRVPTMSAADNLKAIGELRMVFGSTAYAIENLAAVQRAAAVMKTVNPERDAHAESYNLSRALELKGVSNDPQHFNRLMNMAVQAVNASRGKISGEDFLHFARIAGTGTTRTLSDDFYTRVAPTLIQEMTAPSAGRALTTFRRQLLGGHMQIQSASEWLRLGLLNRKMVEMDKIGHVKKIHPGALVDSDLFSVDPYSWIHKHLAPALAKRGITSETAVARELATLFSDRYAENAATILLTQQQRIEKDRALIEQAPGTEAIDAIRTADPKAAFLDLSAGIDTLLASIGSPLAAAAIRVMNELADGARYLASAYAGVAKFTPQGAGILSGAAGLGLGYVGFKGMQSMFGLVTGSTALKGSALALNESAAAINAAAARLGLTPSGPSSAISNGAKIGAGSLLATGGVAAGVIAGGAGLSYEAARAVFDNPASFKALTEVPMLGALGGDYTMAAAIAAVTQGNKGEPPKAELSGDAKLTVEVQPSPDFITRITGMIENAITGVHINGTPPVGTSGSIGNSMPEAATAYGP